VDSKEFKAFVELLEDYTDHIQVCFVLDVAII
jgi:hypothetical protein